MRLPQRRQGVGEVAVVGVALGRRVTGPATSQRDLWCEGARKMRTVRYARPRHAISIHACRWRAALRLGVCGGRHVNTEASQRVFHQWHVMPRHHGGDVGRRLVTRRCRRRRRDKDEDLGLGEGRAARSVLQRPAQIGHRRPVASGRGGAIDAAAEVHARAGVLWRQDGCTPALVGRWE